MTLKIYRALNRAPQEYEEYDAYADYDDTTYDEDND